MQMEQKELVYRAEAKIKEIEAEMAKFKADAATEANEAYRDLKKELNSLKMATKEVVDDFSETAARRLNSWLH